MIQEVELVTKQLDGNALKQVILDELTTTVDQLFTKYQKRPGLAVVLVGDNPASQAYVGMKKSACKRIGVESFEHLLPEDVGQEALMAVIQQLNQDDQVHGILVQLPLPSGYDEQAIIELIDPSKDVDGFHPINVGRLLSGLPTIRSCTPYGVCELLSYYKIETEGKHVVIVGRSNIVGKPLAAMLVQKETPGNATVTICHSRSKQLKELTTQADILVAAIGQPGFITEDMVKEGAVVIDVGINRVSDPNAQRGYRLVGDVEYESVAPRSSAITPVPGGVGPLTIAMLMKNTVAMFRRSLDVPAV